MALEDKGLKAYDARPDPFDTDNAPPGIDPEKLNEAARWYWRGLTIDENRPPTGKEQLRRKNRVRKHPEEAPLLHPAECGMDWPKDKRRPRQRALRQLITDLMGLYPDGLRKYTMNPYRGSIPQGPLLDYLKDCMETIGVEHIPDSEALRELIRRR